MQNEKHPKEWEATPLGEFGKKSEEPKAKLVEKKEPIVLNLPKHEDGLDDEPGRPAEGIWR